MSESWIGFFQGIGIAAVALAFTAAILGTQLYDTWLSLRNREREAVRRGHADYDEELNFYWFDEAADDEEPANG